MRALLAVSASLLFLVAAPAASAQVILGVLGDADRFAAQTGQDSQIQHTFMSFDQGDHLPQNVATMGPRPATRAERGRVRRPPGNSAQAYYPGDAYVDVIGDDLYDIRGHGATWTAAESLYSRTTCSRRRSSPRPSATPSRAQRSQGRCSSAGSGCPSDRWR